VSDNNGVTSQAQQ